MSRAVWSLKMPEEEKSKATTQMDRQVAAGWFDIMLPDKEFKFRKFTRNIPREDSSLDENASSFILTNTTGEPSADRKYLLDTNNSSINDQEPEDQTETEAVDMYFSGRTSGTANFLMDTSKSKY